MTQDTAEPAEQPETVDTNAWLRIPTSARERSRAWAERLFGDTDHDDQDDPDDSPDPNGDTAA